MRVLVTGAGGFVGPWVIEALQAGGHAVHGLLHPSQAAGAAPSGAGGVTFHRGDVTDRVGLEEVLAAAAPDAVVHLAAWTDAAAAESDPEAVYHANVGGTLALLGGVRARAPRTRVLLASTSLVYGAVERRELPVREETPLRPTGVYGASKAAAEITLLQWGRAYGLDVLAARPFNHTGPGQRPEFVCAAIARQLAEIEAGRREPILRLGNLDPVRDFADVRDVAAGYVALLERGRSGGVYNLCSGEGVSIAEIVALFRTLARLPVHVRSEPARRRALDLERFVGSHARATDDTGWVPRIPLLDTLRAVLDDWRARTAAAPA